MSDLVRSFIAFDIEKEDVLQRIADVQRMLMDTGADLTLVKPENVHVTLRFLGEVPAVRLDAVYEEMKKIRFAPFDIELRGVGAFPDSRRPRIIWIGIKKGAKELERIFSQLEVGIRRLGFSPEREAFTPHVTIARVRSGRHRTELVEQVKAFSNFEFGTIEASTLKLKESVLTPRGPIYTTLREVKGS